MKPETRSKDSDRKWFCLSAVGPGTLSKLCLWETYCYRAPEPKANLYTSMETRWRDNKSYVIVLLLTGASLQTKHREQTEHTCKEACVDVQIHMCTVNLLKNVYFPFLFPSWCPIRQEIERGAMFRASSLEFLILLDACHQQLSHYTWDTSLFSG